MTRPSDDRATGCGDLHADLAGSAAVRQLFAHVPGTDGHDARPTVAALEAEIRGLQERQVTLATIEQAKGMLMGYYGIAADTAFAILVRWSQHSNTKLRDVADALVTDGGQPSSQPYGSLRNRLGKDALDVEDVIAGHEAAG